MHDVKKICLSCKKFRLVSVDTGLCRVDKDSTKDYPKKHNSDHCPRWQNCGQQYYIRLGWIKAQEQDEK